VQSLVDQGATLIYESSNPLGLGPRQAVLWAFRPDNPLNLTFADHLVLIGCTRLTGNKVLFNWYTRRTTNTAYQIFVHLIDPKTGEIVKQADTQVGGTTHPTNSWRQNELIFDVVELPADYSAYRIELGLYELASGARAEIRDSANKTVGDHIMIDLR
jgi:hypothetical protein